MAKKLAWPMSPNAEMTMSSPKAAWSWSSSGPMKDRPRHALRHAAEVFRRLGAGMVLGNVDEEVRRHAEQELDDEHDHRREKSPDHGPPHGL
ncbi:MAG: hypothetical protein ABI334_03140 [Candidatus Dormiibacterota bacterium]